MPDGLNNKLEIAEESSRLRTEQQKPSDPTKGKESASH